MHLGHIGRRIDIIGKVNEERSRLGGRKKKKTERRKYTIFWARERKSSAEVLLPFSRLSWRVSSEEEGRT